MNIEKFKVTFKGLPKEYQEKTFNKVKSDKESFLKMKNAKGEEMEAELKELYSWIESELN